MDSTLLQTLEVEEPDTQTPQEHTEKDDPQEVRRNAAQKITIQGQEVRASDLALISLIAETPEKAPKVIATIQEQDPKLAQRLAKLYQNRAKNELATKLDSATPEVKEAFEALSTQVETLTSNAEQQKQARKLQVFSQWQKNVPELKQADAKKLRDELGKALDRLPEGELTDDVLEDALAVAKRRANWKEDPVKKALDKQAVQIAQQARTPVTPKGGDGISAEVTTVNADPNMAKEFGSASPERLAKIAEAKKAAGFK